LIGGGNGIRLVKSRSEAVNFSSMHNPIIPSTLICFAYAQFLVSVKKETSSA
jgi:hypothetical protein